MKNFSTWLLVMFMAMFWVLRIVITISAELGGDFGGLVPFNNQIEVVLLFAVLLSMILIVKRKMIGSLIYIIRIWIILWSTCGK